MQLETALRIHGFRPQQIVGQIGGFSCKPESGFESTDLDRQPRHSTPVLFLDEPTTGLDPRMPHRPVEPASATSSATAATLLLTTQYLEEADRLADDIVVLDGGRVAAQGFAVRAQEARIGGERLEVTVGSAGELAAAATALGHFASDRPAVDVHAARVVAPAVQGVVIGVVGDGEAGEIGDILAEGQRPWT